MGDLSCSQRVMGFFFQVDITVNCHLSRSNCCRNKQTFYFGQIKSDPSPSLSKKTSTQRQATNSCSRGDSYYFSCLQMEHIQIYICIHNLQLQLLRLSCLQVVQVGLALKILFLCSWMILSGPGFTLALCPCLKTFSSKILKLQTSTMSKTYGACLY